MTKDQRITVELLNTLAASIDVIPPGIEDGDEDVRECMTRTLSDLAYHLGVYRDVCIPSEADHDNEEPLY